MATVRDLMRPELVTLEAEDSLRFAAEVLTSAEVGSAPVLEGSRVVGVVSLTDIVAFEADDPGPSTVELDAADPSRDDVIVEEWGDSSWLVHLWQDGEDQRLAGGAGTEAAGEDPLDDHVVAEVMSRRVIAIASGASAAEAAALMERQGVRRLVVIDEGEVLGFFTRSDLERAEAAERMARSA